MALVRARLTDLTTTLDRLLDEDARLASGPNHQLSKAEQAKSVTHVAAAAAELRFEGGPGTRVSADALSAHLSERARTTLAAVNQPSGVGRSYVSQAEIATLSAAEPTLGARVQRAYAIASGKTVDTGGVAEAHVKAFVSEGGIFRRFSSEDVALAHQDPYGRSVTWLVQASETADKAVFTWGRNDLWAQRFEVDAKSGDITVTGEH